MIAPYLIIIPLLPTPALAAITKIPEGVAVGFQNFALAPNLEKY